MELLQRHPDKGYLDTWLWVPKRHVNVDGTKAALTPMISSDRSVNVLQLWKETAHHLLVPREYFDVTTLPFPVIDCRPREYPQVTIRSRIKLDHRPVAGVLQPTGETVQQEALDALLAARGGILQLACVAGDTELQLNRGGKGFRMKIATAYERWQPGTRYTWDQNVPTFIRAEVGGRIGLQRVVAVLYKGARRTYTITLENGRRLRLTWDHQVLTPNGFRSLKEGLNEGDEVITDGDRVASIRQPKPRYVRLSWYKSHPYARRDGRRGYHLEEHRAVAEARLNGLPFAAFRDRCRTGNVEGLQFIDPKKFHVHHKDENPENNNPDNLEVLPVEEHLEQHRPGASAFGYGVPTPVKITRITPGQLETVYDIVCDDPHHNFVANGIVVHNCGKGKTVVTLELFARLGVPALIVIDNTQLLTQWQQEVVDKLDIPDGVGLIQGDVFDWKKPVVLTTYHTIAARAATLPEEVRRWFGMIVYEEGHHSAAPFFSQSIDAIYGRRYLITATPNRDDGLHIVYNFHVGPVLYKNLMPETIPRINFLWTGCELQLDDPSVAAAVRDKTGELHLKKLAGFFGQWRPRLQIILQQVQEMVDAGRHPLIVSESVDEVVNLVAMWKKQPSLFSDIPIPTPSDIEFIDLAERNEARQRLIEIDDRLARSRSPKPRQRLEEQRARVEERLRRPMLTAGVQPTMLDAKKLLKLEQTLTGSVIPQLHNRNLNPVKRKQLEAKLAEIQQRFLQHEMAKALEREMWRRQREYIRALVEIPGDVGMLIEEVEPETRLAFVRSKTVLFSIFKYGKEGLDNPDIDTLMVLEPFSSRNSLQQFLGRPSRRRIGKMTPVVVILEDNIGPLIGMCVKLRQHLREWPADEGGPFAFNLVGHPQGQRRRGCNNKTAADTYRPGSL